MNPKEEPMVAYYDDPAHFADLMNGWIYRGTKQLMAEQILEAVYGKEPKKLSYPVQRYCQVNSKYSYSTGCWNVNSNICRLFYDCQGNGL